MGQTSFTFIKDYKKECGGDLLVGKRKSARPLSTKKPIHLTLKIKASFFNPSLRSFEKIIRAHANKYQIKIHELALNWTHVHFAIGIPSRRQYLAFIRTVTAEIVRALSKSQKKNLKGLFKHRPYTRILSGWGREFRALIDYIVENQQEAWGLLNRKKKKTKPGKPR